MKASQLHERRSLFRRILRETLSFSALQVGGQVFLWVTNIVLARLLVPRDFGVYGICTFFISMGLVLGDGGIGAALVRKEQPPTAEEYESAFAANLVFGATLTIAFAALAHWLTRLYHLESGALWILLIMAPDYLIGSLRSYPMIRLERDLAFGLIARVELATLALRQTSAAVLALLHFGVWSLILANVASAVVAVVFTFIAKPGLPRFRFSGAAFRPLLGYGMKIQAFSLLSFFKDNVSNGLLGALAGPTFVGLFNFGHRYIEIPVLAVNALARVQLPMYARLQADSEASYSALRASIRTAFMLGIPFLVVLCTGASSLVPLIYGSQWTPSLPVAWSLALNMVGSLAASPLFTFMQARGAAGQALVVFVAWTVATWVLSAGAFHFDYFLAGVGAAHSIATVLSTGFVLVLVGRMLGRSLLPAVTPPLLSGTAAVVVYLLVAPLLREFSTAARLASQLVIPLGAYLLAELLLERATLVSDLRAFRSSISQDEPAPL